MSAENNVDPAQSQASAGGAEAPKVEAGFRVFIGNLSFKTTEDELREFVTKSGGDVTSVSIPLKYGKRPAGYGFVTFKTEDAAKNAVETLQGAELGERKVSIKIARSDQEEAAHRAEVNARKAARTTEEGGEAVEGAEGEEKPKRTSKPKRAARRRVPGEEGEDTLVEGDTTAGGETSDASPVVTKKRNNRPKKATEARIDAVEGEAGETAEKPKREPRERKPRQELSDVVSPNTVFVSNLPFSVDDAALASIFTNLSIRVKSAKVVRGVRKGRGGKTFRASRGFGFVEVEDPSQQKEAVEKAEGSLVGDRKISAKVANEMKDVEVQEVKAEEGAAEATA